MEVVLWNVRDHRVAKDAAGGFGLREHAFPNCFFETPLPRHQRPAPLLYGYLAAVFRRQGGHVRYVTGRYPPRADVYVFCPSFPTLDVERSMIARLRRRRPDSRILVVGQVATAVPEIFGDLEVTVVKGDAEQLAWTLDDVLRRPRAAVHLGELDDLDRLPMCDWGPFAPWNARIPGECWQFPTAVVEHGRGCPGSCRHCPESAAGKTPRLRDARRVAAEIQIQINTWGFYSFRFRDTCFGWDQERTYQLVHEMGEILQDFQFSVETRIDLMPPEMLRALRWVGLRCVTVPVETAETCQIMGDARTCQPQEAYAEFFDLCHRLGLRTIGVFPIGLPTDSEHTIARRLALAKQLGPTFAKFRLLTPYPGTPLFQRLRDRLDNFRYSTYTTQTPVVPTESLHVKALRAWLRKCHLSYYLRWSYLRKSIFLIWPGLARWAWRDDSRPATQKSPLRGPHHGHAAGARASAGGIRFVRHDGPHDQPGVTDEADQRQDLE